MYPSKEDPSVIPVHTGLMERKKRFTRSYRESYFVLTPAGFLHEYASSDLPATVDLAYVQSIPARLHFRPLIIRFCQISQIPHRRSERRTGQHQNRIVEGVRRAR